MGERGVSLAPAERQLEELGRGRAGRGGHGPGKEPLRRALMENILQPPSGSFVCFIKPLETLRCFTAAYPAQPGGTFSTVLYGQIICNIEALMITRNYPSLNYGTSRRRREQKRARRG